MTDTGALDWLHAHSQFITAVEMGDVETAANLLRKYPDALGWREDRDGTPDYSILHFAITSRKPEMVALVLHYGGDLELGAKNDMKPLMLAANVGEPETLALLLERGANASARDAEGHTALQYIKFPASEEGVKMTRWLEEAMQNPAAGRAVKSQIGLKLAAQIADILGNGIDVDNAPPVTTFKKHKFAM